MTRDYQKRNLIWDCRTRGKKSVGKPKKNWVDCLEEDCARANIPVHGEKSNHLAEINLVPNLCQGEIGPSLLFTILFMKLLIFPSS
jgi:hypothetical protein